MTHKAVQEADDTKLVFSRESQARTNLTAELKYVTDNHSKLLKGSWLFYRLYISPAE